MTAEERAEIGRAAEMLSAVLDERKRREPRLEWAEEAGGCVAWLYGPTLCASVRWWSGKPPTKAKLRTIVEQAIEAGRILGRAEIACDVARIESGRAKDERVDLAEALHALHEAITKGAKEP